MKFSAALLLSVASCYSTYPLNRVVEHEPIPPIVYEAADAIRNIRQGCQNYFHLQNATFPCLEAAKQIGFNQTALATIIKITEAYCETTTGDYKVICDAINGALSL